MDLTVVTKLVPESKDQDTDGLVQKHLAKKLDKIEQRLGKAVSARVVLEQHPVGYNVTITLHGTEIVGKAHNEVLLKAVDESVDKLTRQFENDAEKKTGRERQRRAATPVVKQPT